MPTARRARPVPALVLAALALACSGEAGDAPEAPSGAAPGVAAAPAILRKSIDPSTLGSISGAVSVRGTPPERKLLKMVGEAYCLGAHEGGGYLDDRILVSDGRLAGAFVWISAGLEGYEFEPPGEALTIDQKGCLFTPRVVGVQLGQPLMVANSDPIMHNVHTKPEHNRPQNLGMPAGAKPAELRLRRDEVMIEVVCDVHAWMRTWIGVVDHPFFAVTGADGSFRLAGVPPGSYELGIWHEKLGRQTVAVSVGANESATAPEIAFQL